MNHQASCKFLHGHSGKAVVTMCSEKLDDQHMVMDFSDLKKAMSELLDLWDHATILHEHDPLVEILQTAGQRVYVLATHPTAEQLAHFLYVWLEKQFPGKVDSVTIYETEKNFSTFNRVPLVLNPNPVYVQGATIFPKFMDFVCE
jgi:6-pyruvoyltetrahydropterin/6-carboxytetrahydropterin synthase